LNNYGWKWDVNAEWKEYYSSTLNGGTSYDLRIAPLYFLYSGYIYTGSLDRAGARGNYWSSAACDTNYAYYLNFNSARVYPSGNGWRFYGFSIRCLAR